MTDYNLYPILIGAALVVMEMFIPTQFALLSLGVGFLVFGGLGYVIDSIVLRFIFGVIAASFVILVAIRAEKKDEKRKSNIESIIGEKGVAVTDIEPGKFSGLVRVYGEEWLSFSDEFIPKDSIIKVVELVGGKLKVKKV
ncbi:MAG: hypothetical protein NZ870_00360 [bacterium]|nr:hypothetical protein [bacterium]